MWTRLAGMLGASMLLTSLGFAGFGRSASTDMPFTCFFTLSMAILAVAIEKDLGRKVLWAYVFLGLAVLGKGPVALILAVGIGLCFWFFDEEEATLRRWHLFPGVLITAAVSIPWFWLAFRQNGYAFIATFFINHNLARYITDIHHHSQPFYFYLPVLLALFFPLERMVAHAGRKISPERTPPLAAMALRHAFYCLLVPLPYYFLFFIGIQARRIHPAVSAAAGINYGCPRFPLD